MSLTITSHAVDRFISRWRPGTPKQEAESELTALVVGATPTTKRTIVGDATIYLALSHCGEKIPMAVRDRTVITVLPRDSYESDRSFEIDEDMILDSLETQALCQAMCRPFWDLHSTATKKAKKKRPRR